MRLSLPSFCFCCWRSVRQFVEKPYKRACAPSKISPGGHSVGAPHMHGLIPAGCEHSEPANPGPLNCLYLVLYTSG